MGILTIIRPGRMPLRNPSHLVFTRSKAVTRWDAEGEGDATEKDDGRLHVG